MTTQVLQGSLVLADRIVTGGQVVVEDGVIGEVVEGEPRYQPTELYGEAFIVPGLIDVHVHGIAGAGVMDGTRSALDRMSERFVCHGVTAYLPTTLTDSLDAIRAAITGVRDYIATEPDDRAQILGIHLEGPFVNRAFKGMQNEKFILPPEETTLHDLLELADGLVTRVSLAPELPGADVLMGHLRDAGIYISIAHTGATYEQALEAVRSGATQVTHCFNAMTGLHHRQPGVAGAAMLCDDLIVELIPDGIHVHPAVMRLLIRVKSRERVMLVTDSLPAADMPDGIYRFGGHEVTVQEGVARLADGTLASSTVTMDAAVRNVVHLCQVSLPDAIHMASTTPAEAMGLGLKKGRLAKGYDADLAVLDGELRPIATWIHGRCCFGRTPSDRGDDPSSFRSKLPSHRGQCRVPRRVW